MYITGGYDGRIIDRTYTDVAVHHGLLYAVGFGMTSRAKIDVFDEKRPWDIQARISLPCDGYVTVNVNSQCYCTVLALVHAPRSF